MITDGQRIMASEASEIMFELAQKFKISAEDICKQGDVRLEAAQGLISNDKSLLEYVTFVHLQDAVWAFLELVPEPDKSVAANKEVTDNIAALLKIGRA